MRAAWASRGKMPQGLMDLPPEREAEAIVRNPAFWAPGLEPHEPPGVADVTLDAYVNAGRWVVDCPCGSAQIASKTDLRFFCVECGNVWCEGKWAKVRFTREAKAVEAALMRRPFSRNRNWVPSETPADLEAENRENGVA